MDADEGVQNMVEASRMVSGVKWGEDVRMNDPLSMNIVCLVSDIFSRKNKKGERGYIASTNLYRAIVVQVHPANLIALRDEVKRRGGKILQEYSLC